MLVENCPWLFVVTTGSGRASANRSPLPESEPPKFPTRLPELRLG